MRLFRGFLSDTFSGNIKAQLILSVTSASKNESINGSQASVVNYFLVYYDIDSVSASFNEKIRNCELDSLGSRHISQ